MNLEQAREKLIAVDERSKRNEGRIKQLESAQATMNRLVSSVEVLAEQIRTMNGNLTTLTNRVTSLEARPGKQWRSLMDCICSAAIGAIVIFILSKLGIC